MINLLPAEKKQNIKAARDNVVLLRYNIITILAIGLLAVAYGVFYVYLSNAQASAQQENAGNLSKIASLSDVKNAAAEYRSNLSTASTILGGSVSYTDTVIAITKLLPSGVVLDNITLSAANIGKPTVITAHAKDYTAATKLKENFQSSPLFSNVFFQTIGETSTTQNATKDYPVAISLSVTMKAITSQQ